MSTTHPNNTTLPPVRACIFDVDGLLINSEDIYTDIYNNILHSYGKPDLPWRIKAKQQSTGRQGMQKLLDWAQLPLTHDDWLTQITAQHHLFKTSAPLPGVPTLLSTLSSRTAPPIHLAIASSATSKSFGIKTSHLPAITAPFPPDCRVFGDDKAMSDARKKPMPDVFLLALGRINERLVLGRRRGGEEGGKGEREREVKAEECLVFEDSVAGVEAGRRAGMRVCWVPHVGLREVWRGREGRVLMGRGGEVDDEGEEEVKGGQGQGDWERRLWSEDGWAEMLMSLEDFDYGYYGIRLKDC